MSNYFQVKPELSPHFPEVKPLWVCPVTKMAVPKTEAANLKYRLKLLEAAEKDINLQDNLLTACAQSPLFFINTFVYTFRIFETNEEGQSVQVGNSHVPYITWAIQDKHIMRIVEAIESGKDLLTDKSRDMGATWDHIAVLAHRLLFSPSESHLILSRKEDAVDKLSGLVRDYPRGPLADPGTLFGKLDYIFSWLPEWMLPAFSRKKMHVVNNDNGTRIDGESANASAGSSDRRTSIFLDEMAKMVEGENIKRSTRDVAACRLVCSTPNGAGTAYSQWRLSGTIPVFILPWWEHPEKGRGRYTEHDDRDRWRILSPWYNYESSIRTPKEMAIEIDMDHVGSGDTFFEGMIIEEHRHLFARKPRFQLSINWKKDIADASIPGLIRKNAVSSIYRGGPGAWSIWVNLIKGRPDQTKTYTIGCDISKGMGASNSTATVLCNETKEKIMAFADANVPPYEFAKIIVAAAVWVGGRTRPLIIWENNGDPGFDFGNQLVKNYVYPNVFFAKVIGTLNEKQGKRWGWRSTTEAKAIGLGVLRRAYAHGGFVNHDDKALDEALMYVHYEGGGIGPSDCRNESSSARATHGDRVIADMLALIGSGTHGGSRRTSPTFPKASVGYRFKKWKQQKKNRQQSNKFDFSSGR